jgi:hypothetical protein
MAIAASGSSEIQLFEPPPDTVCAPGRCVPPQAIESPSQSHTVRGHENKRTRALHS